MSKGIIKSPSSSPNPSIDVSGTDLPAPQTPLPP